MMTREKFKSALSEDISLSEINSLWKWISASKKYRDGLSEDDWLTVISDIKKHRPVQYIVEEAVFYGDVFSVNDAVLIPRPETEELSEILAVELKELPGSFSVLDIGTGSGVLALTLKKIFPDAKVSACDISSDALETARKNAANLQREVSFFQIDFLQEFPSEYYDVLVSNPPYICASEAEDMAENVLKYEPETALFVADTRPLMFYERIAEFTKKSEKLPLVFLEINQKYGAETASLFSHYPTVKLVKDLSGNERFVLAGH